MRDMLVTLAVFGSIPFIFMRPYVGILVFSWLSYMNPHRLAWGFAYDMPFAEIVAVTTLLAMFFSREKIHFPWSAMSSVWLLFILWMSVTTVFAINFGEAAGQWEKVLKIQLMVFVTMLLINTRERLHALVWVIVASLAFYGVKGGIFSLLKGGESRVWGPPGGFIGGNNELGLALVMTLPLMRYLQLHTANKYARLGLAIAMALTVLAILTTHSRGALVAVSAMAFFMWWESRRKLKVGLVLMAAIPLFLMMMPQSWYDRMATIKTYEQDTSAMERITAWKFSVDMASSRFYGGGYESFVEENYRRFSPGVFQQIMAGNGRFQGAHSIYFGILGEHGYVGLLLFLTLGFMAFRCATGVKKQAGKTPESAWIQDMAAMIRVSLIGYAVGGAFLALEYFDLYYHLVAMLIILMVIVRQQSAAEIHGCIGTGIPAIAGRGSNSRSDETVLQMYRKKTRDG